MATNVSKEVKQATDAAKEGAKEVKKEIKDVVQEQKELLANIEKSTQGYKALEQAMLSYGSQSTKYLSHFLESHALFLPKLVYTMQSISQIMQ